MFYEVIPTKIFRFDASTLTYFSNLELKPGNIVIIPLGKKTCPGIIVKKVKKPLFKTKEISRLLYKTPIPNHLLKAALWLSSFYLSPLPSTASLILPLGVEKQRRKNYSLPLNSSKQLNKRNPPSIILNREQLNALSLLNSIPSTTKLLHGITGSGKTNIYLELARNTLEKNQSVIILVPEIALTPQLVSIFEATFKQQVITIHSQLTESERHQIWEDILLSPKDSPHIVLGARSALFAPLKNLGLIIIDEAHESAYYQENAPRYSALRLASFIAKTLKIPCILGTATPLISDYYLASSNNSIVSLTSKAKRTAITPKITIIDFKTHNLFSKNRYFSNPLLLSIEENLKEGYQTLIFHNRRGSAPMTICENCGWEAICPNCLLPLTLHNDLYSLICHTCGYKTTISTSCPECKHPSILHKGFGTKLLESELKKLFKDAKIARFDADNKKHESLNSLYEKVHNGQINIIIGTQTLARGLDLPNLATVGIVQADSGLSLPDFSSEEKTFHLLTQVIGRVGRGHIKKADVVIQTFKPDSPIINYAIKSNYGKFYAYETEKRKKTLFPPFIYLAKVSITHKTEATTISKIRSLSRKLKKENCNVFISSPTPTFHEHTSSGFTWQIILRSRRRSNLIKLLSNLNEKDCKITLDPPSLL